MKSIVILGIFAVVFVGVAFVLVQKWQHSTPIAGVSEKTIYEFVVKDIAGQDIAMSKFKGKVILVVNTASNCGFTSQYEGLEQLQKKYQSEGFSVIGFPANDFMGQEPGSNAEIAQFCKTKFKVSFPMMEKISVKGSETHPLYKFLIKSSGEAKDVEWNFAKFLVNKDGVVVARFAPKTSPQSVEVISTLEKLLKSPQAN